VVYAEELALELHLSYPVPIFWTLVNLARAKKAPWRRKKKRARLDEEKRKEDNAQRKMKA